MALTSHKKGAIIIKFNGSAPIAQLDRVFGYEPKGRGFESLLAHQAELGRISRSGFGFLFCLFTRVYGRYLFYSENP